MTVHGDGSQTRQWLWTEDLADAILLVLDQQRTGVFNVGGNTEASVNEVVDAIGYSQTPAIGFDRPACDQRYAVNDGAIRALGWAPTGDFWKQLPGIVEAESNAFRF